MIFISGERVYLKTFSREEYHAFYRAYAADPVMAPYGYVYDYNKVDENFDKITEKEEWYPRVGIFLTATGEVFGELSFKRIDREKSRCELGIVLANDAWKRRGYGTEAIKLAIGYAFCELGLETIYADTMGGNAVMRHILEKLGFALESVEPRKYDMRDRFEDKLNYALSNGGIRNRE